MYLPEHPAPTPPSRYVSTGRLPVDDVIVTLLESAHGLYAANSDGELSQVYPVLAQADSARYGLAIAVRAPFLPNRNCSARSRAPGMRTWCSPS